MKRTLLYIAAALLAAGAMASCGSAKRKNFLRAEGTRIVNDNGEVLLRGFGLGGWVLQEPYMLRLTGGLRTQSQFRDSLASLMGEDRTAEFYRRWWTNGIQKRDIDSLAAWGFNHVRMPMHYNQFTLPIEKEPVSGENTWIEAGFAVVDNLLSWCAANEIYLILDLHAAPGGQGNDVAISDASPVKMWQDRRNVDKAIALWVKLAERYRDEEWIGGYDVINEPNWGFSDPENDRNGGREQVNGPLKEYLVEVTEAIRAVDKNHLIVIEGNAWGNNYNGVFPLDWDDNTAISFHKYWNPTTDGSIAGFIEMREQQNAPLWMSESGENSNTWFTDAISLFERHNIGWCWWTYKRQGNPTPMEIIPGEGYGRILDYWAGRGPKPTADETWAAMETLAENYKQENTVFHKDIIDAMFRQVATTDTKPWAANVLGAEGLTIPASDYDLGRNGYAYNDLDVINIRGSENPRERGGNRGEGYRNDGVDIFRGDVEGGNGWWVGQTEQGEWLKFTVNAAAAGEYKVTACVSTGTPRRDRSDRGNRGDRGDRTPERAPEMAPEWSVRDVGGVVFTAGPNTYTWHMTPGENIAWIRFEPVK